MTKQHETTAEEAQVRGSVIVLELNELCPPLLERFMAAGDLPNLSRFHAEARCYVTDAEEPQHHLNPWIQWVTAHTGVGYEEHGIFKLGEGAALEHVTVADAVAAAGGDVWLCGPMNVVPTRPVRGWWLPDPWNPGDRPVPAELGAFADFVRANVQEHTNVSRRLGAGAYARFLTFMVRHGLSRRTLAAAAGQLLGERRGRAHRWQRAALLDHFQWDLFQAHWASARPRLATYFSNTTAHYQHVYWRHMDPDAFDLRPDADELVRFADAVPFGYRQMDRIVGDAVALADDDTTVVLCTALSQQPYVQKDDEGGNRFHRPYDMATVLRLLGVDGVTDVAPVMSAQFHAYFATDAEAEAAEARLAAATVDGRAAFDVRRVGTDVFTGCAITDDVAAGARLMADGRALDFHEHYYRAETAKSGYHHPEGALWVRGPQVDPAVIEERVPLRAVAPTLLALLEAPIPPSMSVPPLTLHSPG